MSKKSAVSYVLKALILYGIIFCISRISYTFAPFIVILICIFLCIPNAATFMYLAVMGKTIKSRRFEEKGLLARINNGKIFLIIFISFFALVSTFAMFLEIPTWRYEWLVVLLLLPVYFLVYKISGAFIRTEIKEFYAVSYNIKWCTIAVPVIMCIIYFVCDNIFIPKTEYLFLTDAFLDQSNILESSPSAFVEDAAKLTMLFNAFYYYVIGRVSTSFPAANILWNVIIYWAIFCNITNILNCFVIPSAQLKRIIIPITTENIPDPKAKVQKKYVVLLIFLMLVSITAFLTLDNHTARLNEEGHFTRIEQFIRDKLENLAVVIDDAYYQYQPVMDLMAQAEIKSSQLQERVLQELVPLIDSSFDARLANVDLYLDWYYSLPADYARLANLITGSIEDYMKDKLTEYIDIGVDDTEWIMKLEQYARLAEELGNEYLRELEKIKMDPAIPEWLIQVKDVMSMIDVLGPLAPSSELMNYKTRFGMSAAVGIGAGVITTVLVNKLIQKQFFQKVVAKAVVSIAAKIAPRIATTIAASAAAGAAAGTAVAPGPGTIAGGIVGGLVGVGVALATDYALLMIDEAMNRENYRNEMIETIEEQRQELLEMFQ